MDRKLNPTKPGAVAMITVMLMSIILLVLVIGLVQLMLNEQRQSSDNELTNRAFYAAEAGLESARQYVSELSPAEIDDLTDTSLADADCLDGDNLQGGQDPHLIDDENYRAEVVCQKISGVGGTYTVGKEIGINQPRQYDLGRDKANLEVEWAVKGIDSESFRSSPELPRDGDWDSPAVIRLQMFGFQRGAERSRLADLNKELYLLPAAASASESTDTYDFVDGPVAPVLVECDSSPSVGNGEKMCSVTITNIQDGFDTNMFVRISYLYATTTTDLTPTNSSGETDDQLSDQLRVDSTGRVGNVFRRIQANIDLSTDNLPAYTLVGNQICKTFEITNESSDFNDINNNSDTDYCKNTP